MPFLPTYDYWTNVHDGYLWIVDPDVEDDLSILRNKPTIKRLEIEPIFGNRSRRTRIPSLDFFTSMEILKITDMDITNMPRIPKSIIELKLIETNLSDINQINVDWSHIVGLELNSNPLLTKTSLIIPEGVQNVTINGCLGTTLDIIRCPSTINIIYIGYLTFNKITGYLPKYPIQFGNETKYPNYCLDYNMMPSAAEPDQEDDEEPEWEDENGNPVNVENDYESLLTAKCWMVHNSIKSINTSCDYLMYEEFGAIQKRIRNPFAHKDEPIVTALFLRSNYLRRAAEFMTEDTFV